MRNKSKSALEKALVRQWSRLKKPEKDRYYFDVMRPRITSLLERQMVMMKRSGAVPSYSTLVLILGHDVNPALIIANSVKPERLVILYTGKHLAQLEQRLLPNIHSSIKREKIKCVEIHRTDHDSNLEKIRKTVKEAGKKGNTLCDITGGKKVFAAQLGIVANELGLDLAYIDAHSYIEKSGVPEPGEESLYILSTKNKKTTEISLRLPATLVINYVPATNEIIYNLDMISDTFKYSRSDLSRSSIEVITEDLNIIFKKINRAIETCSECSGDIKALSSVIRKRLFDTALDRRLKSADIERLRVIVDPEVAGIPWEIALHSLYGVPLPVTRMYNKSDSNEYTEHDEDSGILVVIGAGNGIANFDSTVAGIEEYFAGEKVKAKIVRADSKGRLQRELSARRYSTIIYFGHSLFDDYPESTGWQCSNGEIFCCRSAESISLNPPDIIISNSCHSARAVPFSRHSYPYYFIRSGVRIYIGTFWFLELERSLSFLSAMIKGMYGSGLKPADAFAGALASLEQKFGSDDISMYNYVYYGV